MKIFNLYCDESCHIKNDGHPFMLLSYLSVPYNQIKIHKEFIKDLKIKHHFYGEIKWNKISTSKKPFFLELVDYFFSSDLLFRTIIIKKQQINSLDQQEFDNFYYKMYYQLIHHKIDMAANYNIYLDFKDTLSKFKVRNLMNILQTQYGVINKLQIIHSKESVFLQLADLLMGAVNYKLRKFTKVKAKVSIIEKIEKQCQQQIDQPSFRDEKKFNLFFIELK